VHGIEGTARAILAARAAGVPIEAASVPVAAEEAYAVQDVLTARRVSSGERVVGWKLGYTSAAMREALGIHEPNAGPLTDAMVLASPACLPPSLIQPRAEPEIAVVIDENGAVSRLLPALEVVDSVWTDYRFDWAHNTADGSSAAAAVLATRTRDREWLDAVEVVLSNSAGSESRGRVADQLPDLEAVVTWLGALLPARGSRLAAGCVVLTGGLLAPMPLPAGGWVRARFTHEGTPHDDVVVEAHRPERNAS
jgi:2-keto-4-pentenoate hydratase